MGESGCGKTTLARSIMGVNPQSAKIHSGQIYFQEKKLLKNSSKDFIEDYKWKKISFIPQSAMNSLDPVYRIIDQMREILVIRGGYNKKQADLKKAIDKGSKVVSNQKESYEVLVEISKSVPKGVVLTDLIFQNKNEFTIKGESGKDSGIIKLIENLNQSDLIEKATLNTMGVRDGNDNSKQAKIFDVSLIINLLRNVKEAE